AGIATLHPAASGVRPSREDGTSTYPGAASARLLIVIVNYRTPLLTIACLRSLESEIRTLGNASVIVADNGSGDGSAEQIRRSLQDRSWTKWVSLVALESNGGFASGNNAVLRPLLEST